MGIEIVMNRMSKEMYGKIELVRWQWERMQKNKLINICTFRDPRNNYSGESQ